MAFKLEKVSQKVLTDKSISEIILNDDQKEIFKQIQTFCGKSSNSNKLLVTGFAGTGKTTLTTKFIDWFNEGSSALYLNIAVTAPTHKAVKVLRNMSLSAGSYGSIKFSTLHSLLGLRPVINDDGTQTFKTDPYVKSTFGMYDLVIIDEASMIDDGMFNEIMKQNTFNCKIIFVGDSEQIPPINQDLAIPFDDNKRKKYEIEKFSLTKIVRQASENPIIKITKDIRDGNFDKIDRSLFTSEDTNGHGVYFIEGNTPIIRDELKKYFTSPEFKEDSDYCKVIAWRNKTVNSFNNVIRKFLFGDNIKKVVVGEKLIADAPILSSGGKEIEINTNEDLTVKGVNETFQTIEGKKIEYYDVLVSCDDGFRNIKILSDVKGNDKLFNEICEDLAVKAKSFPVGYERTRAWKKFYKTKEIFASVKYNYAITAHRSQGSTYNVAFVVSSDICVNSNTEDRRRILYTASSRPKEKLFIL